MDKRNNAIDNFFSSYEKHFNEAISQEGTDVVDSIKGSFAKCFVESSPVGVICGKNDDTFVARVKQGFAFYRSIGSKAMNIVSKDISILDDLHALVKVSWRYSYVKDSQPGTIDFNVFYFLTFVDGPKIFAYVAGDEQKALKEKGLIPEEQEVQG